MERKAKVRGQSPPWMTWRKRLEVSVIGNIVFPKLNNSFKVQTLDKTCLFNLLKMSQAQGSHSFTSYGFLHTGAGHRESAPEPLSVEHPGWDLLEKGQAKISVEIHRLHCTRDDRGANGFSQSQSGNSKAKCVPEQRHRQGAFGNYSTKLQTFLNLSQAKILGPESKGNILQLECYFTHQFFYFVWECFFPLVVKMKRLKYDNDVVEESCLAR